MTIEINQPEIEAIIQRRVDAGLNKDAQDVVMEALQGLSPLPDANDERRMEALQRLKMFGKTHGLSLGGLTIRELREESRP